MLISLKYQFIWLSFRKDRETGTRIYLQWGFLTLTLCSTTVKAHNRLLPLAPVTYDVLQSRPSSYSLSFSLHSTFPHLQHQVLSESRDRLHIAAPHYSTALLHFVLQKVCMYRNWQACVHRLWLCCVWVLQGVVPLSRCQQWLLLIVARGGSISQPFIRRRFISLTP